jgi:signal transduction histidine kinase
VAYGELEFWEDPISYSVTTFYDEFNRLKELLSYNILDTKPDIKFDEITSLAAHICSVPFGFITLIDETRMWIKSCHGLEATETSREISMCAHAIQQSEIFEVPDAREDRRFADSPLVTGDLGFVFYAGYPLKTFNGYNLGTLCVVGQEPKKLTAAEKEALEVLANQVVAQMELIKSNAELKNLNLEIKNLSEKIKNQSIQVANASKMASLGFMAKGISHEINNPLSIIYMITNSVRSALPNILSEKLTDEMEKIDVLVARMSKITKGLELFSRDSSKDLLSLEKVEELVENVRDICAKNIESRRVEFKVEGLSNQKIMCRAGEVSQVILSLVSNSLDAMDEYTSNNWIKLSVSEDTDATTISVSDSGRGIDDEHSDKVMDPFFTARIVSGRVGLGLSTSQAIMNSHEGKLLLDRESKNTKFDMIFPKIDLKLGDEDST